MFQESVKRFADHPALLRRVDGRFQAVTYREMGARVRMLATALLALGIDRGDRVALLSENRPEWAIVDFATLHIGAVNVGIFPTIPASQVEFIVADSGAKCLIVSDREQLAKALAIKKSLPDLCVISINQLEAPEDDALSYDALLREAEASPLH